MNYFNVIMTNDAFLVTNEKKRATPTAALNPEPNIMKKTPLQR